MVHKAGENDDDGNDLSTWMTASQGVMKLLSMTDDRDDDEAL